MGEESEGAVDRVEWWLEQLTSRQIREEYGLGQVL